MKPKRIRSKTKITNTSEMLPLPNICKRGSKTDFLISASLTNAGRSPSNGLQNDCACMKAESSRTSDCSTDNESTLLEEALLQWEVSPELRELYRKNRTYCQLICKSKLWVYDKPLGRGTLSEIVVDTKLKKKKKKKRLFSDETSSENCGLHSLVLKKLKELKTIPKDHMSEAHTEPRNDFEESEGDSDDDEESMSSRHGDQMNNHFLYFYKTSKQIDSFRKYIKHRVPEEDEKKSQKRMSTAS